MYCGARIVVAELVREHGTKRQVTWIPRIRGEADVAHFARGLPVALVEAQNLVAEARRREPPALAELLGVRERRADESARPLALSRRSQCEDDRSAGGNLGARIAVRAGQLDRPQACREAVAPAEMERVDEGCIGERPPLNGRVALALGDRKRLPEIALRPFVVRLDEPREPALLGEQERRLVRAGRDER